MMKCPLVLMRSDKKLSRCKGRCTGVKTTKPSFRLVKIHQFNTSEETRTKRKPFLMIHSSKTVIRNNKGKRNNWKIDIS